MLKLPKMVMVTDVISSGKYPYVLKKNDNIWILPRRRSHAFSLAHETHKLHDMTTSPPLLVIHGLLGSKRNWQSFAKALSRTGREVITVDARNHGDSPHKAEMTYDIMCEDMVKLMHELGLRHADVLGHSMGGKIAMTLALKRPELVHKLIIEDVAPSKIITHSKITYPDYLRAMERVKFDHTLTSVMARKDAGKQLREAIPDRTMRNFILTNLKQEDSKYIWQVNIPSLLDHIPDISGFPSFDKSFDGDTLFVVGANSQYVSDEHVPVIKQLFPASKIVSIEKAGHWVHFDQPGDFLQTVLNFLDNS